MADSSFVSAFNPANRDWAKDCAEDFQIASNSKLGIPGTYTADNIDDLTDQINLAPGGLISENTVALDIQRTVIAASGLVEGAILIVRGRRVRVNSFSDDSDDTLLVLCGTAGVSLR